MVDALPVDAGERELRTYVRRIELLAVRTTAKKLFEAANFDHLHSLQRDIFNLQIDLQRAIATAKQRKRSPDTHRHLENMRRLRWFARRLGDAVAWNVLLLNRQVIHSLNGNSLTPIPTSWSDGHRGMFEFAERSTSREWGIPIVHDITSVLRVGDVTFMLPSETGAAGDATFRTVELKTTRLSERMTDDGRTSIEVQVTVVGNEPLPYPEQQPSDVQPASNEVKVRRPDRRIERQLRRMDLAVAKKNAPLHEYAKIGDQYHFSLQLDNEEQPHWAELRRAIRAARRDGFAYFELGGFVGYALFYNAQGVTGEDIKASPLPQHVVGLLHEEIGDRNSITVSQMPDDEDDAWNSNVLPFYLWDVPQRAIRDLIRKRLLVTASYNSGWMEKLLTDAGLTVIPDSGGSDKRAFEVVAHFGWEGKAKVEYHSHVWEEMYVAVHEFRGPLAVLQRALAVTAAPKVATFDKFIPAEDETEL